MQLCTRVVLLVALAAPLSCFSQNLYKCGNTYSQTPCAPSAEPIKVHEDHVGTVSNPGQGQELCRSALPRMAHLNDPYSAVVESVGEARHDTLKIGTEVVMVKRIDVIMNSKNSYGAYTGSKLYRCYVSVDEQRLLEIR